MKRITLLLIAAIGTVVAQKHGDANMIVHTGSKIFFQKNAALLKRLNLVIHKKSLVSGDDFNPRLVAATLKDAAATGQISPVQALTQANRPSHPTAPQNNEQYYELLSHIDILKGEIAGLRTTTAQVSGEIDKIFRGAFNLPKTALAPQDAARLAAVEQGVRDIDTWRETALSELPIISVISDVSSFAALAPYISAMEQTKGEGVGAKFTRSMTLPHGNKIEIRTSVTLDGCGESLSFANSTAPQLVVEAGAQLYLEQVTLKNIHANTILIKPGGKIVCGQGVVWELNDSVTLSSGIIELAGSDTVLQICGVGGQRHLSIRDQAELQLFSNTVMLRDVLMSGTPQIYANDDVLGLQEVQYGALALCGNASVVVEEMLRVAVIAVGRDNMLLARSGVYLGGPILFADDGHNQLGILIQEDGDGVARCSLGSEALYVTSARGTAQLTWHNRHVAVRSQYDMPLVVGAHGSVRATTLELLTHPIVALGAAGREPHPLCTKETTLISSLPTPITTQVSPHFIYTKMVAAPLKDRTVDMVRFHDRVVYQNTASVAAMTGAVCVDGGVITNWSTDDEEPLDLTIQAGAQLTQVGATSIKYEDNMRVKGKANRLVLTGAVEWQGGVVCDDQSELLVYCAPGSRVTLNNSWRLGIGARVTLCGTGAVSIDKAAEWTLAGAQSSGEQPSYFVLRDGLTLTIESTGMLTVRGSGVVCADEQAAMLIDQGGRVHVGMTSHDELAIILDRKSSITVGYAPDTYVPGVSRDAAYFSCAYGTCSLQVTRDSAITVYEGSTMGLNWRKVGESVNTAGICTQLSCVQGGSIELREQATLLLGQNDRRQHRRQKIAWIEHGGGVYGPGMVGYAATGSTTMPPKRACLVEEKPLHCRNLNESAENIALVLTQPR